MITVADAQREVRTVYLGGFFGGLVAGALWLVSAAAATWMSPGRGIAVLVVGGMFIFPLTQLLLKLSGRRASLARENPMSQLAMQVAFTVPLSLPLVGAATLHRQEWFYPAMMIVVGAHYLPFAFLYGMPQFLGLGGFLLGAGLAIGLYASGSFTLGGWLTGIVLVVFAFIGRAAVGRDAARVRKAA